MASPSTPRDATQIFSSRLEPPPRPPPLRLKASFTHAHQPQTILEHLVYPSVFTQPFDDPHETLCSAYNTRRVALELPPGAPLPDTIDVPVLSLGGGARARTYTPTLVLAVLDAPAPSEAARDASASAPTALRPLLVPVNAELCAHGFKSDFARELRHAARTGGAPPFWDDAAGALLLTLPVKALYVPHPPSIPLLLLFGSGEDFLRGCAAATAPEAQSPPTSPTSPVSPSSPSSASTITPSGRPPSQSSARTATGSSAHTSSAEALCTGLLTTYLLPLAVIEEFPAVAAMPAMMAQRCGDAAVARYAAFSHGLWRNALVLAPKEQAVADIVGTALRVSRAAQRLREKMRREEEEGRGKEGQGWGQGAGKRAAPSGSRKSLRQ